MFSPDGTLISASAAPHCGAATGKRGVRRGYSDRQMRCKRQHSDKQVGCESTTINRRDVKDRTAADR